MPKTDGQLWKEAYENMLQLFQQTNHNPTKEDYDNFVKNLKNKQK